MKAHKNNSKTFKELTYSEEAKSISAQILSLEKAILAHKKSRATKTTKNVPGKNIQLKQVERMVERLKSKLDSKND